MIRVGPGSKPKEVGWLVNTFYGQIKAALKLYGFDIKSTAVEEAPFPSSNSMDKRADFKKNLDKAWELLGKPNLVIVQLPLEDDK